MTEPHRPTAKKRKEKNFVGNETLLKSIKEKETLWLRRAVSPFYHK